MERGERRAGSFCYKAMPEQPDDDVTALNYPWCFAGKMNEVRRGRGGGVNEDTHSHFICILIMCGDSYTSTDDNKKKEDEAL